MKHKDTLTKEIAIIYIDTTYTDYGVFDEHGALYIASAITDWATVTDEELNILQKWAKKNHRRGSSDLAAVIVYKEQSARVPLLLQEIIEEAKTDEVRAAAKKHKAAAAAKKHKEESITKELEKKHKLYKKLKAELHQDS
jgi:hypothetical protein